MIHRVYKTLFEFIEAELPNVQRALDQVRLHHPNFANYQSYKAMMVLSQYTGFRTINRDGDAISDLREMEEFLKGATNGSGIQH